MATGKNSGGWRGNRPAPQNANDATPAKPGWKQSAARPVAATTGFSLHRKISLALTALATLLIAVFLAWLFLPSNKLLTFVINPVSTLHSAPTTITHAANPPELTTRNNELNPVEILSGKPTDELAKIRKALESNQDSRKPTAAVIIYLQVIPVVNRNPIPSTNTPQ